MLIFHSYELCNSPPLEGWQKFLRIFDGVVFIYIQHILQYDLSNLNRKRQAIVVIIPKYLNHIQKPSRDSSGYPTAEMEKGRD